MIKYFLVPALAMLALGSATLRAQDETFSTVKVSGTTQDWEVSVTNLVPVGRVTLAEYKRLSEPLPAVTVRGTPTTLLGKSFFYGMVVVPTAGSVNLELSFRKKKSDYPVSDILVITKRPDQSKPTFTLKPGPNPAKAGKCKVDPSMYLKVPEVKLPFTVKNPFLLVGLP